MSKQNSVTCAAQKLCEQIFPSYCNKYPQFENRIGSVFFHISIYQQLLKHRSVIGSKGRALQVAILESFEQWYPNIERANAVEWIELWSEVVEAIQGETADYGYGWDESGVLVRENDNAAHWGSHINHHIFHSLPISDSPVPQTNQNQEIIRLITEKLLCFWPQPIDKKIPGEQELFSLLVDDVSMLLLGQSSTSTQSKNLDAYLYYFQSSVLLNIHSKERCARLASSISTCVKNIQSQSQPPRQIDIVFQLGFNYPQTAVKDFNRLVSLLDEQIYTMQYQHVCDGFEVLIWRYPNRVRTEQSIIISGNGKFRITQSNGNEVALKNAGDVVNLLNNATN